MLIEIKGIKLIRPYHKIEMGCLGINQTEHIKFKMESSGAKSTERYTIFM